MFPNSLESDQAGQNAGPYLDKMAILIWIQTVWHSGYILERLYLNDNGSKLFGTLIVFEKSYLFKRKTAYNKKYAKLLSMQNVDVRTH